MNKLMLTGRFSKVWHEEGKAFVFKVSVRRQYKNNDGKYDWDNITVNCPAFNKSSMKYIENYVDEGDIVDVEGHINTYTTEKDGKKIYHEDKVCDSIAIAAKRGSSSDDNKIVAEEKITAGSYPEGFEEAGIDDDDCPF